MNIDEHFEEVHRLAEDLTVRLRLLVPSDREAIETAFLHLSPESRYRRFFSPMPRLPDHVLDHLVDTDNYDHLALVAERLDADGRPIKGLGIARFVRFEQEPVAAEASVVVVDDFHRRGLGRLLLSTLTRAARERGIEYFRAHVLHENQAVRSLLATLVDHPEVRYDSDALVYDVRLPPAKVERDSGVYGLLRSVAAGLIDAYMHRRSTAKDG